MSARARSGTPRRNGCRPVLWNAKPDAGRRASGIPPPNFGALDPNVIDQVGCVDTAQGFAFEYVGVIWGRDLRGAPATNTWIGDPSHSHDAIVKRSGDRFTVKRTYRVLLTRGLIDRRRRPRCELYQPRGLVNFPWESSIASGNWLDAKAPARMCL